MDASLEAAADGNYIHRDGAIELKRRIEAYWLERGFEIQVVLVYGEFTQALRTSRVDVRSDLLNGWPRATLKRA
jgi:hypothetical protein